MKQMNGGVGIEKELCFIISDFAVYHTGVRHNYHSYLFVLLVYGLEQ